MLRLIVFVTCILFHVSCDKKEPSSKALKLNQIQLIGSHNSYKMAIEPSLANLMRDEGYEQVEALDYSHLPLWEQLDLGLRVLELDVYHDPDGGRFSSPKGLEWLEEKGIESEPFDVEGKLNEPGFKVFHVQDIDFRSHSVLLKDCLNELKTWSMLNPRHLPIFITINAKDKNYPQQGFTEALPFDSRIFESLDEEIMEGLFRERLFLPKDLVNGYNSVEEAVLAGDWPSLEQIRGKFILILDEGDEKTAQYLEKDPLQEKNVMFVNVMEGNPAAAIRIVNDPIKNGEYIRELVDKGYMVRTRADADTREAKNNDTKRRDSAFASGAQLVSTDYYLPDPRWSGGYQVAFAPKKYVRVNPHLVEKEASWTEDLAEDFQGVIGLDPATFLAAEQKLEHILLDVRTEQEVNDGVIRSPIHIDFMNDDFEDRIRKLEKNKPVFVYCKVGGRSAKAVEKMKAIGFEKVYHLDGGIDAWSDMGLPVEKTIR